MHLATTASRHQDNSHLKPSWNHLPVPQNMEQGILAPRDGIRPIELCPGVAKRCKVHARLLCIALFWRNCFGFTFVVLFCCVGSFSFVKVAALPFKAICLLMVDGGVKGDL